MSYKVAKDVYDRAQIAMGKGPPTGKITTANTGSPDKDDKPRGEAATIQVDLLRKWLKENIPEVFDIPENLHEGNKDAFYSGSIAMQRYVNTIDSTGALTTGFDVGSAYANYINSLSPTVTGDPDARQRR